MALEYKTLEELHAMLVNKETTAEAIVKDLYERIEDKEDQIGAFLHLNKEQDNEQTKKIDEEGIDPNKVLSGLPIAIKDNMVTQDETTTAASRMLENFVQDKEVKDRKNLKET